jgi:hydroxymethylbilane synthase
MEGGCQVPIAGYAYVNARNEVVFTGLVASPDGKECYKEVVVGMNPEEVGREAADRLAKLGAKALIDRLKEELDA